MASPHQKKKKKLLFRQQFPLRYLRLLPKTNNSQRNPKRQQAQLQPKTRIPVNQTAQKAMGHMWVVQYSLKPCGCIDCKTWFEGRQVEWVQEILPMYFPRNWIRNGCRSWMYGWHNIRWNNGHLQLGKPSHVLRVLGLITCFFSISCHKIRISSS